MFLADVASAAANVDFSPYSFDSVLLPAGVGSILQMLKRWEKFSWISDQTPGITRFIAVVAASLTAAGMNIDLAHEQAGLAITLHGVSIGSVLSFAGSIGKNYMCQSGTMMLMDLHQKLAAPPKPPGA